jgi:hypothetical protein
VPTTIVIGTFALVGVVVHWIYHVHPTVPLSCADTALSLVFCGAITGLMLVQVFGPGRSPSIASKERSPSTSSSLYSCALAYELVALSDATAFGFTAVPPQTAESPLPAPVLQHDDADDGQLR